MSANVVVTDLSNGIAKELSTSACGVEESQTDVLKHASGVIDSLLSRLHQGRMSVESTAERQVKFTRDRIHQVSSATEDATMNIMDACDRALSFVDELESSEPTQAAKELNDALCGRLRDELFSMMGALQFQDITAQQLAHAAGLLDDMEASLLAMSQSFDPTQALHPTEVRADTDDRTLAYDPNATTLHAEARQSLVDDLFSDSKRRDAVNASAFKVE